MLQTNLEHLERADLVRRARNIPEIEYWFKHGLVQETTYAALLKHDRKRLHRFVAEVLERAEASQEFAALLALHWDNAGETERAFGYYVRAGQDAARVYANVEALAAFDRACELARGFELGDAQILELYLARGRVMELRDAYVDALQNYADLEQLGAQRNATRLQLEALIQHAKIHSTPNTLYDLAHARILAQDALTMARELNDRPAQAKVLWNLVLIETFTGHPQQAIAYGETSLALARELNLREQLAYTLNDIVRPYGLTGQMDKARAAWNQADALWRELNNLPMLAGNLTNASLYAFFAGLNQESIALAQEGLRVAEQILTVWGQAYAKAFLGSAYFINGEWARALELLEQSIQLGRQAQIADVLANGYAFMGLLYRGVGMVERGVPLLEQGVRELPPQSNFATAILAALGILYAEQNDLANARASLEGAEQSFDRNFDSPALFLLRLGQASLALAAGAAEKAAAIAQTLTRVLAERRIRPFLGMAQLILGRAQMAQGNWRDARATLEKARIETRETENRATQWEILAALTRVCERFGETERAEARREGQAAAEFVAEHLTPELRDIFLKRAEVRVLMQHA